MKVVVDVINSEKIKDLTAEIQRQEQAIAEWNKQMAGANAVQQAYLKGSMEQAAVAINKANAQLKEIPQTATQAGRGLSQLSYALDDVQYGFNAIVNNIPQIALGLGAGAGLAGVIGILAVAINQLIKHWAEVSAAFEAGFSNQSYDQLVAVKKAAEEAAESYQKLAAAKTEWEEKGEKIAGQAVANVGAARLRTSIAATLGTTGEGAEMTEAERRAVASVQNANPAVKAGVMERIMKRLNEENAKEAEKIIGGLTAGGQVEQKARDRLAHLIKINPEGFSREFRDKFGESDPAKIKEKERQEEFEKNKKKIEDKEEELNKKRWHDRRQQLQEEKQLRIQGLEDERDAIQKAQRDFDAKMWDKMHKDRTPAQILQGARSATDYYQTGTDAASPKQLAKEAHAQREKTNKLLEGIDEKMKKERRLVVPN